MLYDHSPSRARLFAQRITTVAAALAICLTAGWAANARAQGTDSQQIQERLGNDIKSLVVNMPVWMSSHLPAMMGFSGNGAGIDMDRDGGDFSIGLTPIKLGVMNQFSQVGAGTEIIDLESLLPGLFPWPQFGLNFGIGLGAGFEIGGDFQFLPELDLNPATGLTVSTFAIAASLGVSWRVNEAEGALPSFSLGVSGSYYHGYIEVGVGFSETYEHEVDRPGGGTETVTGSWAFNGGPRFSWDLFQVAAELRVAWDLEVFRPYVGFGFGFNFGDTTGEAEFDASATLADTGETVTFNEKVSYSTPAASYLVRPLLGFDIVVGIVAINLQMELAVLMQDNLNLDLGEAAGSFDPTQEVPFNKAKESQTSAAFVTSLGLRFQF